MKKRGITPVIATVLLIAIVVVLALIIFLWARGFIKESLTKQSLGINQACDEVNLEASYDSVVQELQIANIGNIPVHSVKIKIESDSETNTIDSSELEDPKSFPIGVGVSLDLSSYSATDIGIIPKLLAQGKKGTVVYVCEDKIFNADVI